MANEEQPTVTAGATAGPAAPAEVWQRSKLSWVASLVALVGLVAAWAGLLYRHVAGCPNLEVAGSYAGDPQRFRDYVLHHNLGSHECSLTSLGAFHTHLVVGALFALVYGPVLFVICHHWWPRGWLTKPFTTAAPVKWLALVAAAFDLLENVLLRFAVTLKAEGGVVGPSISQRLAQVLPVVAWIKVLSFAAVWFAALFTLLAVFSRRRLVSSAAAGTDPYRDLPVEGFGICCSGGGIRAASISLGVLGALERNRLLAEPPSDDDPRPLKLADAAGTQGILYQADYIASVSGGGYATGGWRVASATDDGAGPAGETDHERLLRLWPQGVVGDPRAYPTVPPLAADTVVGPGAPSLYRHLQQRREFLRTGRGGFPGSFLLVLAYLIVHLVLITGLVVALAWPVGRLTRSWFVFGGVGCVGVATQPVTNIDPEASAYVASHGDLPASECARHAADHPNDPLLQHSLARTRDFLHTEGPQLPVTARMWSPAAFFAAIALALFLSCLVQWNTLWRRRIMAMAWGSAGAAVAVGAVLVGIPWLLDVVYPALRLSSIGAVTAITSAGGATAVALGFLKKWLEARLAYLGGVLLALGAVVLGLLVAGNASAKEGVFGLSGKVADPVGWLVLITVLVVGYFLLCPRWWSLHTLYRNRLRGAFVTTRAMQLAPKALRKHQRLMVDEHGEYLMTPGPKGPERQREAPSQRLWPLAQSTEPLVQSLADAPKPVHLVCCSAARTKNGVTGVKALSFVISPTSVEYYDVDYTPSGLATQTYAADTERWTEALGAPTARRAEGTVSAAISVSGAAFAPAMGRFNMGTTNALFAALNLRLGSWFPNPRYVPKTGTGIRFPWVRLSYVLKELTGHYDLADHHIYVTDGGHRENLGIVELLRRRCATIVCVDASGDTPGSYTTLRQAADLALVEVGAVIDLGPLNDRPVRPMPDPVVPQVAYTVLDVTYTTPTGPTKGRIIHLAPVMFSKLSADLVAYGFQDQLFPHYSTGDQFLTEEQFHRLVLFGRESAETALADPEVLEAIAAGIGARPTG